MTFELGCGNRKRLENSIGIDMLDYPCVDVVGDLNEVLRAFPAESVNLITSHHVFEHLDDLEEMLDELARVLRPGGEFGNCGAAFVEPLLLSDATHKYFWTLYPLFSSGSSFKRQVPSYKRQLNFEIFTVDLIFKSSKRFYTYESYMRKIFATFPILRTALLFEKNFLLNRLYLWCCSAYRRTSTTMSTRSSV